MTDPRQVTAYDPETNTAYELGFKSTLADNTLQFEWIVVLKENLDAALPHLGQHLVDDRRLHPLHLGLEIERIQGHVVEVGRRRDVRVGVGRPDLDARASVAGLDDGPSQSRFGAAGPLDADDDAGFTLLVCHGTHHPPGVTVGTM